MLLCSFGHFKRLSAMSTSLRQHWSSIGTQYQTMHQTSLPSDAIRHGCEFQVDSNAAATLTSWL